MPPRPRRIALIAPVWYPIAPDRGGIEQMVFLLARELVERGHEVTLVASGDSRTAGRLVAVCEEGVVSAMEKGRADDYAPYEAAAIAAALRIAPEVDVVHSHLSGSMVPFTPLLPVPVLHTMHCPVAQDISWLAGRFPDVRMTVVSRHLADSLRATAKVAVVPNGIELEGFSPSFEAGDFLLYLGRVEEGKGVRVAMDVAAAAGFPLVIAGDCTDRAFFTEHIANADPNGVRYVGRVGGARKAELLRRARALLFPVLKEESFGLVLLEAMASGTPVVALRKGAVAEVVTPGVNGFYADEPAELPALVARVGEIDRRRVAASIEARYSHHRMVDAYVDLYRQMTAS